CVTAVVGAAGGEARGGSSATPHRFPCVAVTKGKRREFGAGTESSLLSRDLSGPAGHVGKAGASARSRRRVRHLCQGTSKRPDGTVTERPDETTAGQPDGTTAGRPHHTVGPPRRVVLIRSPIPRDGRRPCAVSAGSTTDHRKSVRNGSA